MGEPALSTPEPLNSATSPGGRHAVPIMTYHSLDGSGSVLSTVPSAFREQMSSLARRGFVGIGLGRLLEGWAGRATLPERPVVLTFDDGYRNFLEHAWPTLEELRFGATIFVVAGLCGKTNDWPNQAPDIPRLPLLGWDELASLSGAGFEIGSHTLSHPRLTRTPLPDARREIVDSKKELEDRLGKPVETFAYPFGLTDAASVEIARAHYRGACSTAMGVARRDDDLHLLPRIDAYYLRGRLAFRLFETIPGRAYLGFRAIGRSTRAVLTRYGILPSPY